MSLNKKGQAVTLDATPTIILVVALTILVAAASAIALDAFKTNSDNTGTRSYADSNTFTADNTSAVFFGDYDEKGYKPVSCIGANIYNGTNNLNVTSNYTISTSACTAALNSDDLLSLNGETQTINYTATLTTYDYGYNISHTGELSLDNFSGQVPTIGTIIGVALIVMVIIGAFAYFFGRNNAF